MLDVNACFETQVRPAKGRLEESARRAPAPAPLLVDLEIGGTLVVAGIEVGDLADPHPLCRLADSIEQVPTHPWMLDAPFAATAVELVWRIDMVFVLQEVGHDVIPGPALQTQLSPAIVIGSLAAHVDHGVDRRGAADHLAAGIGEGAAAEPGDRGRLK